VGIWVLKRRLALRLFWVRTKTLNVSRVTLEVLRVEAPDMQPALPLAERLLPERLKVDGRRQQSQYQLRVLQYLNRLLMPLAVV